MTTYRPRYRPNRRSLLKGAGNDVATSNTDPDPGVLIAAGTNFRAIELPLPA